MVTILERKKHGYKISVRRVPKYDGTYRYAVEVLSTDGFSCAHEVHRSEIGALRAAMELTRICLP